MSLKAFIARNISYPLQDLVNGTHILETLKSLNESQYWSLEKQENNQFEKFQQLLHHSVSHVPYYRELFKNNKLRLSDIKTPDDIQKIPILTKKTARTRHKELIADNVNWKEIIKGITGGTTGPPLNLLRDIPDRSYTWAAFYRWYSWMGLNLGDSYIKIWGTPTVLNIPLSFKIKSGIKDFYYNRHMINSFNLNEKTIPGVIKQINKCKPSFIRGYLSAFIQIAEFMVKHDIRLSYKPKAISSTTETLYKPYKRLIENTFDSKLFDQYGCGECNSIAFDSGDDNGLHITTEHCMLEVLDQSNEKVENDNGKFIITNLNNYAMPFIRYENGDSGRLSLYDEGKAIKLPQVKEILGRTADTITLKDGSKVHGVFFTDILHELFGEENQLIHRFQAYQIKPGELEFRIEKEGQPDKEYFDTLEQALMNFFKKVNIVHYAKLPHDKTGKFRYVLSDLEK